MGRAVLDDLEPGSLWQLTAPASVGGSALPDSAGVVVAGGGLAGLATALELLRHGHDVVVIEAAQLGGRTTARTTGKVSLLQGATASGIRRHAGDEVLRSYLDAHAAGAGWLRRELAEVPRAWEDRTAFTYATTDEGEKVLGAEAEAMSAVGEPVDALPHPEAGQTGLPFAVRHALRREGQGQLHPVIATHALVEAIRAEGGRMVDGCRLLGASNTPGAVDIETTQGTIRAQCLVVATGSPVLDRSLLFATLKPQRQAVVAFRLRGDVEAPTGMYLSVDPVARSLRTARDRDGAPAIVVGGGDLVTGRRDAIADLRDDLADWTVRYFPGASPITWWAAQDYRSTTRLPFAGAIPGSNGRIFALTGFAKWGMTGAAAAALVVSGEISGQRREWWEPIRAHRPGLRDVIDTASTNLATGAHLVSGWMSPGSGSVAGKGAGKDSAASTSAEARVERSGIRPVAETRVGGVPCRISAVCTHLGGVVRWNDAEQTWDCPLHGSRFTREGRVIEGPAVRDLPPADDDPHDESA